MQGLDYYPKLSLKLRPNNQLTLTKLNVREQPKKVYGLESWQSRGVNQERRKALTESKIKTRETYNRIECSLGKYVPPLDIIKKSQRATEKLPRAGFGILPKPKSFTSRAGQKLRECGAAIDKISSNPANTYAVTLTLPSGTHDSFEAMAKYSGYAINRLIQPLRRENDYHECLWFFVWEYQKRGALHLHFALYHPNQERACELATMLKHQWFKVLCDISEKSLICMFTRKNENSCTIKSLHQNDVQPMRNGLGNYFSKYAGKKESKQSWYCKKYPVSRFWGCCQSLKELIKSFSLELNLDFSNKAEYEKYSEIVYKILSEMEYQSLYQYSFSIDLQRGDELPLNVCNGMREVYYVNGSMYDELKEKLHQIDRSWF